MGTVSTFYLHPLTKTKLMTDHEAVTDGCSLEGLKAIRDPGTVLMMDLLTINGGRHDISWPLLIIMDAR